MDIGAVSSLWVMLVQEREEGGGGEGDEGEERGERDVHQVMHSVHGREGRENELFFFHLLAFLTILLLNSK